MLVGIAMHVMAAIADEDPYFIQKCELPPELEFAHFDESDGLRPSFPVSVVISDDFNDQWLKQIHDAIEEWNRFSKRSLGFHFFKVSKDPLPAFAKAIDPSQGIDEATPEDMSILAIVPSALSYAHGSTRGKVRMLNGEIAHPRKHQLLIRISTTLPDGPVAVDSPQIQSVALHELGHAIGLDHACGEPARHGHPAVSCEDLPFEIAEMVDRSVMYPGLKIFTYAEQTPPIKHYEIKERLTVLDSMRAFCLYKNARPAH
jgi:hypothetical protein